MKSRSSRALLFVLGASLAVACEQSKSSSPLSPSIAGPIPGVNITSPKLLLPSAGSKIPVAEQPVTLLIENSASNGVRPVSYVFEVAMDAGFTNKVFTRDGVQPGEGGRTSLKLPDPLASGRTYYWRAQALDGANSSAFSAPANFDVYTPVVIEAPAPASPANNQQVTTLKPTLTVRNAARSGPAGAITYTFQVSENESFGAIVATAAVPEQATQTAFTLTQDLVWSRVYYWRARASDPEHTGPWSVTQAFVAPNKPAEPPPPPPPGPDPGSGPAAGDAIDLRTVRIVKGPTNFSGWSAASTVTDTRTWGGELCIWHTMLGRWPTAWFFGDSGTLLEGNQWVFAYIRGQWYGGAADWYRPGQACKGVTADSIGRDAFYDPSEEPLHSWVPRPGENIGLASSTPARAWPDMRTLDQRTNVVVVPWKD